MRRWRSKASMVGKIAASLQALSHSAMSRPLRRAPTIKEAIDAILDRHVGTGAVSAGSMKSIAAAGRTVEQVSSSLLRIDTRTLERRMTAGPLQEASAEEVQDEAGTSDASAPPESRANCAKSKHIAMNTPLDAYKHPDGPNAVLHPSDGSRHVIALGKALIASLGRTLGDPALPLTAKDNAREALRVHAGRDEEDLRKVRRSWRRMNDPRERGRERARSLLRTRLAELR